MRNIPRFPDAPSDWPDDMRRRWNEAMQELRHMVDDIGTQAGDGYQMTNFTETRVIDGGTATLADLINFTLTLAQDFKDRRIIG